MFRLLISLPLSRSSTSQGKILTTRYYTGFAGFPQSQNRLPLKFFQLWTNTSCSAFLPGVQYPAEKVIVQEATMETEETQVRPEEDLLEKAEQTEEAVQESLLEIRIA